MGGDRREALSWKRVFDLDAGVGGINGIGGIGAALSSPSTAFDNATGAAHLEGAL
jgi:hypothetical protein